jgi:hypothetical protein
MRFFVSEVVPNDDQTTPIVFPKCANVVQNCANMRPKCAVLCHNETTDWGFREKINHRGAEVADYCYRI